MKHIEVEAFDDPAYGIGYKLPGVTLNPNYEMPMYFLDGTVMAHDLLEHVNGLHNIGTVHDELEALGGMWWVRGRWGEINRSTSNNQFLPSTPQEVIASELQSLAEDLHYGFVPWSGRQWPDYHEYREEFEGIRDAARRGILDIDHVTAEQANEFLDSVVPYMLRGLSKARKRFSRYENRHAANNMFWNIAEAVNRMPRPEFGGQTFLLSYSATEANFCETTDHGEDYDD